MRCIKSFLTFFITHIMMSQGVALKAPAWKHCVHNLYAAGKWKEFNSPGFPHGITTQTQCSWIITSNPPQRIKLAFHTLNLTGSVNNCFTQSVVLYELQTGSRMGTFCGDKRPGDYVSFGNQLRIDLLADTAAAGHQGFLLKYKSSKEVSGFKKTFTFTPAKPKLKAGKSVKRPVKTAPKPPLPNGGKVNLPSLVKQRKTAAAKRPNSQSGKKKKGSPQAPIRYVQRATPSYLPTSRGKLNIVVDGDKEEDLSFNLYVVVGICCGGVLFIIIFAIIIYFCFCKKPKKENPTENNNHLARNPVNALAHPIQRRHHLPCVTAQLQEMHPQVKHEKDLTRKYQNKNSGMSQSAAEDAYLLSIGQKMALSKPVMIHNGTSDVNSLSQAKEAITPVAGGYVFHCSSNGSNTFPMMTSPVNHQAAYSDVDDHPITTTAKERQESSPKKKKKKIPTLKRKFSEWEKERIRKGTFKE